MMLAAAETLRLLGIKSSDFIRATLNERGGEVLALTHRFEESTWSKASADDQAANSVGNVNKSIDNFDIWRLFQKNCRVKVSTLEHSPNPFNTQIRRVEDGVAELAKTLTPSGKTAQNDVRFQWVPVNSANKHVNRLSRFADRYLPVANDNSMPWHPLDAA